MTSVTLPKTRSGEPIRYGAGPNVVIPAPNPAPAALVLVGLTMAYTVAGQVITLRGPNRPQPRAIHTSAETIEGVLVTKINVRRPQSQVYGKKPAAYTVSGKVTTA